MKASLAPRDSRCRQRTRPDLPPDFSAVAFVKLEHIDHFTRARNAYPDPHPATDPGQARRLTLTASAHRRRESRYDHTLPPIAAVDDPQSGVSFDAARLADVSLQRSDGYVVSMRSYVAHAS
jgi:hypothetical protein